MGTNGGLTYHVHDAQYNSPDYPAGKMSSTKYEEEEEIAPHRIVLHYLTQTVSYLALIIVICSFGFVTGLEALTYPLLIRKMACTYDFDVLRQAILPTAPIFANMVGSIGGGIAIDKIGRRPVFVVACFLALVSEVVCLVSMEMTVYLVSRSLSSLMMGCLYTSSLLYCIETVPVKYRLHSYLLHFLSQSAALTLLPFTLAYSPFDEAVNSWTTLQSVACVILSAGFVIGILYPEPSQSAKIRVDAERQFQSRFSVVNLDNDDQVEPEPHFGLYTDMFYPGGRVVAGLLLILCYVGGLITTSIYFSLPILSDAGGVCPLESDYFPKPCLEAGVPDPTTLNEMMAVLGSSLFGCIAGYILVQRYGRKNSYRGPAAFRVIVVISMVLCASHSFMLAQAALIVVFSSVMDFTLSLYNLELYAVRSRATSFGLLVGIKLFGVATCFLVNPLVLTHVTPDMKFSVITVVGTLIFGCSLGLRKETFIMSLNIDDATVDVGY